MELGIGADADGGFAWSGGGEGRRRSSAARLPGLAFFRFNAPLTFFNADYFKQRALRAANQAGMDLEWFVIDAIPISDIDTDGLYASAI